MRLSKIASKYRKKLQERDFVKHDQGFVMIHNDLVTGWRDELRNPETEVPGTFALASDGEIFVAVGGNNESGAEEWVSLKEYNQIKRDENTLFEKRVNTKLVKIFITKNQKIKVEFTLFKDNEDEEIFIKRSNVFESISEFYNSSKNYRASFIKNDPDFLKLLGF